MLDLAKAFDSFSWKVLELTMASMNICDLLIKLVMECVTSISFSLLIEGEATDRFYSGRGLC